MNIPQNEIEIKKVRTEKYLNSKEMCMVTHIPTGI